MKKMPGFSLIEIIVILAIVSILGMWSIPLYTEHLAHERRLEAATTLSRIAIALEDFYTLNNSYQEATLSKLGFTNKTAHDHYVLHLSTSQNSFTITAEPTTEDRLCGTLSLNAQGEKNSSGKGKHEECW